MTADDIPDPLLEDFEQLERLVGERKLREWQDRCPHDGTVTLERLGHTPVEVCTRCGRWLTDP